MSSAGLPEPSRVRQLWRYALWSIQAGLVIHYFRENVYDVHSSIGPSMLPTLNMAHDVLLLDKWHYRYGRDIKWGDLIVAKKPTSPDVWVCKRVVGMPGDVVCVNPTEPPELYEYVKVPKAHVWLVGDNMSGSLDSRSYGPVPMGLITAKVVARAYPDAKWMD